MKKYIIAFYVFIALLISQTICYTQTNNKYTYFYNSYSNYFCVLEFSTNKITNFNLNNILPNNEEFDYADEIVSRTESDYQTFSIKTKKKKVFWFIVNKHDTSKNYITPALSGEKTYGYNIISFNNYIFYPKSNKNNDFCLFNVTNKKETIIKGYYKSILDLHSLPKNIYNSIEETRIKSFYDYTLTRTGDYIYSDSKIFFTVKYFLGGGGVGRQLNLQYARWISLNPRNNACKIEKENFYTTESIYKVSNDTALIFTKEKIIEYHLKTNSAKEYNHSLNLLSLDDPFDKAVAIFPLVYKNNKLYFMTDDVFKSPEKRQLISFDFSKSNILYEKKDNHPILWPFYSDNNFITVCTHKNEKELVFEQLNIDGKMVSSIKTKGAYPYNIICQNGYKIYITAHIKPNLCLLIYDSKKKAILNTITLGPLDIEPL